MDKKTKIDKENRRRIKITILGIIGLILLVIGISFSAFSANLAGTKRQSINTGCLKIDMTDKGSLNIANAVPESDESGLTSTPYTYTITNSCTTAAFYTTTINVMNGSNVDNVSKVKVSLDGDSFLAPTIESNLPTGELLDTETTGVLSTYKLDEGYLKVGESKTFELRTWIDYDVEDITGGLENKIIINSEARGKNAIIYKTNTSGYYALSKSSLITNADYKQIAPSANQLSGIIKVEDDSNIKYYFRGNPKNYLTFAGKNFRVLSTNEDGSINIVLASTTGNSTYSNIATSLTNFYNTISSEETYIKTDSTFCKESASSGNYLADLRYNNYNPSINCQGDSFTKVGLLTVDDLMFAGAKKDTANTSFYLKDSASYFTGSSKSSTANFSYSTSNSITSTTNTTSIGVKPVITLKSNVMLQGEGTEESPFYVNGLYEQAKNNYKDIVKPVIDIARVDEKWSKTNKNIEITAHDDSTGSGIAGYLISTSSTTPSATSTSWEASSQGKYESVQAYDNGTYYVFVKDKAGNISEGKKVVIEKVDKTAPTCTIRINPNGEKTAYKTLSIISDDKNIDLSGYSWDHTTSIEDVVKVTVNGVYTGYLTDLAGNQGSCSGVVYKLEPQDTSGANEPVLSKNMIPVYYDEEAEVWKKADKTNKNETYKWYNYDEKMWANSVTLSEANRSTYLSAEPGTEISMDDILTMQVWIPRYKYKVWNYNADGTATSEPQEIEITFESGTETTGEISCTDSISGTDGAASETCKLKSTSATCTDSTCNGKTYTHPAFTFGDTEVTGMWVGKFEISAPTDSTCYTSASEANCNKTGITPLVKPDVKSYRYAQVGTFETNMMAMNDSDNIYGFATTDDTHMMKNMEWGAVAYLSHSKYGTCTDGTCTEINKNDSSRYYTGRSGGGTSASSTADGTYKYNETKIVDTTLTGGTSVTPTITNDTTYPWTEEDGLYKSSTQGVNSSTTNLTFSFTAPSDNTYLSFDWSVSSESSDYIYYTITKDEAALSDTGTSTKIGGTTLGTTEDALTYKNVTRQLEAGSYEITFTYRKDSSDASGTDTGYVKNIKILDSPTVNTELIPIGAGKDGLSASTTGNIYGIYDMSGGAYEHVMGNIVSTDGTTMMSGYSTSGNSGYTGILYNSRNYTSYTGTYSYPENKYLDKYSFGTSGTQRIRSKLGDAVKEVYNTGNYGWYSDNSSLAYSYSPWFDRGGWYNASNVGVFYSDYVDGRANFNLSSRLVITP